MRSAVMVMVIVVIFLWRIVVIGCQPVPEAERSVASEPVLVDEAPAEVMDDSAVQEASDAPAVDTLIVLDSEEAVVRQLREMLK